MRKGTVNRLLGHIARFWRRVRVGPNPLARRWDRIEAALLSAVVTGAVLAVPVAAFLGTSSYADQVATAAREHLTRHRATATMLADAAPPMAISEGGGVITDTSTVPARWTLPGGIVRTGTVNAPCGSRAGATVPIWLTSTGDQSPPPLTHADAVTAGVLTGAFTWLAATSLLAGLHRGGRVILDRRRTTQWDRDWEKAATQWAAP
jgi:hypothetical protein